MKIYPSLISADLLNLETVIKNLEPHCDGFHIDIMDNHFVPNLTWGPMFIKAIAQATEKPLFIHLMIDNPEDFLEKIHIKRASTVSFHIENTKNILQTIKRIKENKWHANIAIKPNTPLDELKPFLNDISSVLLMSVEPGFSGQQFLNSSLDRLKELADYRKKENLNEGSDNEIRCGAETKNHTPCEKIHKKGSKRCGSHKGKLEMKKKNI